MTEVSSYVRSRLDGALLGDDARRAVSTLAATKFPLADSGSLLEKRIHLAIVKLVCEPWDSVCAEPSMCVKFESALNLAKTDWRDLLVSVELENDDWPQALSRAGFEGPS